MPAPTVKSLFDRALEIDSPADRQAYLDAACAGDPDLRQKVDDLLQAYADAGGFLEPSLPTRVENSGTLASGSDSPEEAATGDFGADAATGTFGATPTVRTRPIAGELGTVIAGRYTLVNVIGEGGMGSVYLASQTEPVKRQVALKLIKAGMDSDQVLARFDAERQALALMDHPNIARIYDGGVTAHDQPFFVMELVHG